MAANPQWSYVRLPTLSVSRVYRDTSRTVIICRCATPYSELSTLLTRSSQCPPTPRIPFVNLPGHPFYLRPLAPEPLFPINLSQPGLSSVQANLLSDLLPAFTTISVRDASNQVLCSIQTGSDVMTTADFAEFLQHLVRSPLPSYAGLSPVVRESVKVHFISRHGWRGHEQWDRFARGTPRFGIPAGLDLLLGNTVLWMLDLDARGVWIATVDVPRAMYYQP
ncbi:hypothetical protein B0H11DRAFT_2049668 [Mycena galericulata]|nr:hypothetical protein B0H11DRAFT_2049668 [Mycena galericulata]